MKNSQKMNVMSGLRDLIHMYREEGYIDSDSWIMVIYQDGTRLSYPDDCESIKLRNIRNVIFCGSDDPYMDFTYDFIGTPDMLEDWINLTHNKPCNPLIKPDLDDCFKLVGG